MIQLVDIREQIDNLGYGNYLFIGFDHKDGLAPLIKIDSLEDLCERLQQLMLVNNCQRFEFVEQVVEQLTIAVEKAKKLYFIEDYVRVYPDDIAFNEAGIPVKTDKNHLNNFLNHQKFYRFVAQFVTGKSVADIGCGSGHGCHLLRQAGAAFVAGSDMSEPALRFAMERYGEAAEFSVQGALDLVAYEDDAFDVTVSSEVLEHIKEHGCEVGAIDEMKRVTKDGGLVVIGTPNSELLGDHGFFYEEIDRLMQDKFDKYVIFENALLPFGTARPLWEERVRTGRVGVIVSEDINLDETVMLPGMKPEIKQGLDPEDEYEFYHYRVNTRLLHNTHSWCILAINQK